MNQPKAYNELVNRLLREENREKFEWAVGAVLADGPRNIVAFRGHHATGKTTLSNIVRKILMADTVYFVPQVSFRPDIITLNQNDSSGEGFQFLETLDTVSEIDGVLSIETTGDRIPTSKYYILMEQINSEVDAIAEICLNKYHIFGEGYYSYDEKGE